LRAAGWPKARALVGGWAVWKSEGLPVELGAWS
jgi:3-mercaptopyruvate sulfurtransferase SseA